MKVGELSNDELLARLDALCAGNKRLLAELLAHLGEVDARGVYRELGFQSMFAYCLERLGISEPSTWRRLHAARMCRRIPSLLGRIERGEVHLSMVAMINPKVSDERCEALLSAIAGKSKRQAEEILADADPKPEVKTTLRQLPAREEPRPASADTVTASRDGDSGALAARAPEGRAATEAGGVEVANGSDLTEAQAPSATLLPSALAAPPSVRVEALSAKKHKLVWTMSTETLRKLERASALMRHANPTGDMAVVIERAIDALMAKLERTREGKTSHPRAEGPGPARTGYVSAATRRAVFDRDGSQCTFTSDNGKRCSALTMLELDHVVPRGRGGPDDATNLRVRCRTHNQLEAERVYGKEHIARRIAERKRQNRRDDAG